jgi:hypothetical protein
VTEAVFHKVQLGRQSVVGTGVAATTVFPVDAGFLGFELDRAVESPNEDFGRISRENAGRNSYGARGADASIPFVARFQDLMHPLEMHCSGSVTPTGETAPYTYVYLFDETADTLKPYTIEYGDAASTQDEFRAVGVLCNELELGFDALTAPGNAMWRGSMGLMALNREANAMTASQVPPTTLSTMEGHYTTLAIGSTATAFGSLTAQSLSLAQFNFTSTNNLVRRIYGGTTDIASAYGRSDKAEVTWEALIKIAAGTKTSVHDVFAEATTVPTEYRFRVAIDGDGDNVCNIDFRSVFTAVDLGDRDGERLYQAKGKWIYDSTLTSRGSISLVNAVSTVP